MTDLNGEKTAMKTARRSSPRSGVRPPIGAHPGNTGGKKGRSGRKSHDYLETLREIVESDACKAAVRKILRNPKHPQFAALYRTVLTQVYGLPSQRVDVSESAGPVAHATFFLPHNNRS